AMATLMFFAPPLRITAKAGAPRFASTAMGFTMERINFFSGWPWIRPTVQPMSSFTTAAAIRRIETKPSRWPVRPTPAKLSKIMPGPRRPSTPLAYSWEITRDWLPSTDASTASGPNGRKAQPSSRELANVLLSLPGEVPNTGSSMEESFGSASLISGTPRARGVSKGSSCLRACSLDIRFAQIPASVRNFARDRKHNFLFKWAPDHLHTDGQTFRRASHRHDNGWIAKQVEPLAVTHRLQIIDSAPVDRPLAFAVPKSGNRAHRAQQNRVSLHLPQNPSSQIIALKQSAHQLLDGQRRLLAHDARKFR